MAKIFNILSIDGGGILGLYAAEILHLIQKEILGSTPLHTHFQLITGTSTGALITMAIASGSSPQEIIDFYHTYGIKIFPPKLTLLKIISLNGLLSYKYSKKPLQNALINFFGDKKVRDCKTHFCIPAVDISLGKPVVFKTDTGGQLRDLDTLLTDIALGTTAAPTYFPPHQFGQFLALIDGGVWQNNPALCGLIEAWTQFVGDGKEYDRIRLLSLGTPLTGIRETINISTKSGAFAWNRRLMTVPMKVSAMGTHYIVKTLQMTGTQHIDQYLRIITKDLPEPYQTLRLDAATRANYQKMHALAYNDYYANTADIHRFFAP